MVKREDEEIDEAPHAQARPGRQSGFTLLELIIVIAIIGILATIAMPALKNVPIRAKESVLKTNLRTLRDMIDQYYGDKGKYPTSLEALVDEGYLRKLPIDPMTKSTETWVPVYEESDPDHPPAETDSDPASPGIVDVHSGAPGNSLTGPPTRIGDGSRRRPSPCRNARGRLQHGDPDRRDHRAQHRGGGHAAADEHGDPAREGGGAGLPRLPVRRGDPHLPRALPAISRSSSSSCSRSKPRCIRQLWKDPMTKDGKWGLIFQNQGVPLKPQPEQDPNGRKPRPVPREGTKPAERLPDGSDEGNPEGGFNTPQKGDVAAVGPIVGVYSKSSGKSHLILYGHEHYNEWRFTEDLLRVTTPSQAASRRASAIRARERRSPTSPPAGSAAPCPSPTRAQPQNGTLPDGTTPGAGKPGAPTGNGRRPRGPVNGQPRPDLTT